jgi:Zn-finger nucleic acid-binding protein
MVALRQPHLHYECCKLCGGVFLDAGEFSDYKRKSLLDLVKDLFAEPRP